jgi:hypothetical protein
MMPSNNNNSGPTVSVWDRSSLLVVTGLLVVGTLKTIAMMMWEPREPELPDNASILYQPSMAGDDD